MKCILEIKYSNSIYIRYLDKYPQPNIKEILLSTSCLVFFYKTRFNLDEDWIEICSNWLLHN